MKITKMSLPLLCSFVLYITLLLVRVEAQLPLGEDYVLAIAWHPDSTQIAIGFGDGTIQIRNVVSDKVIWLLQTPDAAGRVVDLAWSPDGITLASTAQNSPVHLWNPNTGQIIRTLTVQNADYVNKIDWHNDIIRLAGITQSGGVIHIWDTATEVVLANRSIGGEYELNDIAWHGNELIIGVADSSILLDGSGGYLKNIGIHDHYVISVSPSADGIHLLTGGMDSIVSVWDINTGEEVHTFTGHTSIVISVAWHPDGILIASAGYDGTIRIWDSISGQLQNTIQIGVLVLSVQWSPDGRYLAYSGGLSSGSLVMSIAIY